MFFFIKNFPEGVSEIYKRVVRAAPKPSLITLIESTCLVTCGELSFLEASSLDVQQLDCGELALWQLQLIFIVLPA